VKIVKRFSRASITFYRIGLTSKLKSEWNRFRGAIIQFGRRKKKWLLLMEESFSSLKNILIKFGKLCDRWVHLCVFF
jgi:hypothetical protein